MIGNPIIKRSNKNEQENKGFGQKLEWWRRRLGMCEPNFPRETFVI